MVAEPRVTLKKGREKSILSRHPWIFSGAIANMGDFDHGNFDNGNVAQVVSADGELLGRAYFNRSCSLIGRVIAFGQESAQQAIERAIDSAIALRKFFIKDNTDAYRLINGEGDNLPGLVVDYYCGVLVLQISTLGMEKLKPLILELLINRIKPKAIFEKSDMGSRSLEGLKDYVGDLYSTVPQTVEILENDHKFLIKFRNSQKTGFFLDQREMRALVSEHARAQTLLNCFSYTGGFSVYAAKAGASLVDSVDISKDALELAKQNFSLNGIDPSLHGFVAADVFDFLRTVTAKYNFIILDPPAFAKKANEVEGAMKGYADINRLAINLLKTAGGGLLLTCSCSYYVNVDLFKQAIFHAAKKSNSKIRIIQGHRLAYDHPVNIFHPEGNYLKSFLIAVD